MTDQDRYRKLVFLLFFLSGVSGLIYQIVWTRMLVLVFGNALIIALEGLVAGIQTTRLVLFEFFVRFLRAEGRPFRPILPPLPPREQRRHT